MGWDRTNEAKPVINIWADVPLPSVGEIVPLLNGQPSGGVDVGALAAGIEWQPLYELLADEVENTDAPIGHDKISTGLNVVVPMKEVKGYNLQIASGGKKLVMGDGTFSIRIGTGNEIESHSWLMVWERRAGSGIYEQAMVYNGVVESAAPVPFTRSDYTVLNVTIVGRAVAGRDTTDNLGYCTTFQ